MSEDDGTPVTVQRAPRYTEKWEPLVIEVNLKTDDGITALMEAVTEKLLKKKLPVGIVKTVAYVAQTMHKVLSDKHEFEKRIGELERIAGIKVKLVGGEQEQPRNGEASEDGPRPSRAGKKVRED